VGSLDKVFCRFTVHRDAVRFIRFLPKSNVFISSSAEHDLKVWQLNCDEHKINVLYTFKINPQRRINDIMLVNSFTNLEMLT